MQWACVFVGTGRRFFLVLRHNSEYWGWFFFYTTDKNSQWFSVLKPDCIEVSGDSALEISSRPLVVLEEKAILVTSLIQEYQVCILKIHKKKQKDS